MNKQGKHPSIRARQAAYRREQAASLPVVEIPFLTAGQAAKALGIARQSVYDRVRRGELVPAGVTPDGVYVFGRGYIEGIVNEQTGAADASGEDTGPVSDVRRGASHELDGA